MSNECSIYAEMHLYFDNDFDVYSISKRLGISPSECKNRAETRISPLTNKHLEGFWTLKTEEKEECYLPVILNGLIDSVSDKLTEIKKICDENNGKVVFDIVPTFNTDNKPALYFDRKFLDVVNYLNATVDIDLYVC